MEVNGIPIRICQNDLPAEIHGLEAVAMDTETMGLNLFRDRLCLVQVFTNDAQCYLIRLRKVV